MVDQSLVECVSVVLSADVATISCMDGAVRLPRQVLYRSSILQQALSDVEEEGEVSVTLPKGAIQAWVEGLHAVDIPMQSPGEEPVYKSSRRSSRYECIIKSLEAADFLVDKATVKELCTHASTALFAAFIESGEGPVDAELELELCALPSNLQIAVLGTSKVPFLLQLPLLQPGLHHAALHAAFPSISASSSITLDVPLFASSYADPFWQVLGKETSLKSLHCKIWAMHRFQEHFNDVLRPCIAKLTRLKTLNLRGVASSCDLQLLNCLASFHCLTHLDISQKSIFGSAILRIRGLGQLTSLISLSMCQHFLVDDVIPVFGAAITQLSFLQALNMTECTMSWNASKTLAEYFSSCTGLRDLRCAGDMGSVALFHSICSCARLEHLELPDSAHIMQPYPGLGEAKQLATLTGLEKLHMPRGGLLGGEWSWIAGYITTLTRLRALHVTCHLLRDEVAAFNALIPALVCLQELNVRNFVDQVFYEQIMGLDVFHDFGNCISKACALTGLTLNASPVFSTGSEALTISLKGLTDLQHLNLGVNCIWDDGAEALSRELAVVPTLEHLNLSHCELSDKALKHLSEPIGRFSKLQSLRLPHNLFGSEGLIALASQFVRMRSLTELALSDIRFADGSAAVLFQHLVHLTGLQTLELNVTNAGDRGASLLATGLSHLTLLRSLNLSCNQFTCNAVRSLLPQFQNLASLQYLDLSFNFIRNDGARMLATSVRTMPCLKVLDLSQNVVSCQDELEHCGSLPAVLHGVHYQRRVQELNE